MFSLLGVEELPDNFGEDQNPLDTDMEQHPSRTSTPLPRRRPPPPITIDNVEQSAKLLKKLQELTGQKLQGRVIGRGLRVYPETPAAYHQIRNLIDQEKLEAYTYELNENKEIKVVIRGMPVDMPVQEIMEDLDNLFIKPSECKNKAEKRNAGRQPSARLSRKPPNTIAPSPEQNSTLRQYSQAPPPAKPPQQAHIAQGPDEDHSENLASTLEDFQDPRVIEMLDVLKKFVQISKTNKTRAQKFWELTALLRIKETRLRPCHNLNLPNYKTYRTDRLTHRGGGTAVLIKSSIPHHVLDIKTHSLENTTIAIEGERNITISSIYRPPRSPAPSLISDLLRIFRNRLECLAVGDYNAIHRTWNHDDRSNPAGMPSTDLQGTAALPSQPRQTPRGFRIEETAETAHSTSEFLVV
ncbi:RNA-directed DNA polymerase from mobile element jockey [Trichonephila clavipes]|nr:RNA-directed DNA polymerase from mobile element jockey [Trichonephila clavipes]